MRPMQQPVELNYNVCQRDSAGQAVGFLDSRFTPHAKTRDRETTEFKTVLGIFVTGRTSYNEMIRHDTVRTTIRHFHHRVNNLEVFLPPSTQIFRVVPSGSEWMKATELLSNGLNRNPLQSQVEGGFMPDYLRKRRFQLLVSLTRTPASHPGKTGHTGDEHRPVETKRDFRETADLPKVVSKWSQPCFRGRFWSQLRTCELRPLFGEI